MTSIALVRIDDRLIHGQVVVKWLRHLGADEIWIADDQLMADGFLQSILRLAAPPGVHVEVAGAQDASALLARASEEGHNVLLLVKSPQTAIALYEQGLDFHELNVGGLGAGPDTTRVYKSVSLSAAQMASLRYLQERGVRVYFQMVPEERPVELSQVLPHQLQAAFAPSKQE